jgi:hypothetical protein
VALVDTAFSAARAQFTQPVRPIVTMLAVVGLAIAGAWLVWSQVAPVVQSNPWFNGVILAVFAIGVLACFWQVLQLVGAVRWIESFASDRPGAGVAPAPQLLAPLAALLRGRGARHHISSVSARSILDSVAARLDEMRDITRYLAQLLFFLGLLGTFYGLATTVPAVVDTIRSLDIGADADVEAALADLIAGLEQQLGGMGTAFSSTLLGFAGSLVVGLLDLFAGHGQNRFYRELEEWLSSITRIGLAGSDGDGAGLGGAGAELSVLAAAVDEFARLQEDTARNQAAQQAQLDRLIATLDRLAEAPQPTAAAAGAVADPALLDRLAATQERLIAHLEAQEDAQPVDAESRMRLRSIDVQLLRLLEEVSSGRHEATAELRQEIARLTRTIEALGS